MGPGIDFPLIMSYKDTENPAIEPYFYFLNGHNDVVYFADSNFTENQIESYEYNPWGVLLTQASKNNLLFLSGKYENEMNFSYIEKRYYMNYLGRYNIKSYAKLLNPYLYSFSDDLDYEILFFGKNYNNDYIEYLSESYIKEKAWWPALVIVACLIADELADCGSFCAEACKGSGGVRRCWDLPCGICIAECQK